MALLRQRTIRVSERSSVAQRTGCTHRSSVGRPAVYLAGVDSGWIGVHGGISISRVPPAVGPLTGKRVALAGALPASRSVPMRRDTPTSKWKKEHDENHVGYDSTHGDGLSLIHVPRPGCPVTSPGGAGSQRRI
jgi:hypothetical protein